MKRYRNIYLLFALAGAIIPWIPAVLWLNERGINLSLFIQEAFANRISAFFTLDLLISGVFLLFVITTAIMSRRIKGLLILATLLIGVSASLPLYFYIMSRRIKGLLILATLLIGVSASLPLYFY